MSGAVQALIGSLKAAAAGGDPNWSSVTLLLPGNGTNGAQNNTFIDGSTNNFTITRNGNTTQGTFAPFSITPPYSTSTRGGSGYFDGTGDYLSGLNDAAFAFGTGDFTIEYWAYSANVSTPAERGTLQTSDTSGGLKTTYTTGVAIGQGVTGSGKIYVNVAGTALISASAVLVVNTWQHIAVVRSGSTVTAYVDGTSVVSGTASGNCSGQNLAVGGYYSTSYLYSGYLSNLRIVKGTAVYTSNFTPPTVPLTAITNTSLLLNFTNAGIIDNAMLNDLETVGNAQISTSEVKYGTGSMAFDGTGDWLVSPDAIAQQLDTGNFTIEGWLRLNATGVAYGVVSKGTSTTGWSVNVTSGDKLQFSYTATQLTGASSLAINTWYHFAVVRNGSAAGNLVIYLNGVADATSAGAVNDNFNQTSVQYVGASRTGANSLNGYIDDLRITKGVARYTANFTPPGPLPTS